jgi:hypothetical protein
MTPDANGWMPIETAPAGALIDVLISGKYPNGVPYVVVSFRVRDNGHWGGWRKDPPTHWQPLPDPPVQP